MSGTVADMPKGSGLPGRRLWHARALVGALAAAAGFGALISTSANADHSDFALSRVDAADERCPMLTCAPPGSTRGLSPSDLAITVAARAGRGAQRYDGAGQRGASPTAGAPTTQPRSGVGPTTTTTAGQFRIWDRNPPRVSGLRAGTDVPDGPDEIFDQPACGATTIPVEAVVVDESTIRSVTVHWSVAGARSGTEGSRSMAADTTTKYTAELGPFPAGVAAPGPGAVISWWVEAVDKNGNVGRAQAPDGADGVHADERVTLRHCDV